KESAIGVIDKRIEIFEHQDRRRGLACSVEHVPDTIVIGSPPGPEALDVQTRLFRQIDERLNRMSLAVARWSDQQYASFPGNSIFVVGLARREESRKIDLDFMFQVGWQNEILEAGALDRPEQLLVLVPAASVEHQYFAAHLSRPIDDRLDEVFCD